jgi:hypothetical protein
LTSSRISGITQFRTAEKHRNDRGIDCRMPLPDPALDAFETVRAGTDRA